MAEHEDTVVQRVWEQARARQGRDPDEWRQDQCGAWMNRTHYNSPESEYGWRIVNVVPGGEDVPENLQALHRGNEFDLANGRPKCAVTADRTDIAPGQQVDEPRNTEA